MFDPDAPGGGVTALVRRDPDNMGEVEMVKAVWGSDPRFSDGINFRFVRSEGRAFPKRRCLIPASEFRSKEHTSALQPLMRISYAVFSSNKKNTKQKYEQPP